jgi:3-hydroxyisobutyrate dehydrogenase
MTTLQRTLAGAKVEVLDVAILSGVKPMNTGTAGLLVGGSQAAIARIEPLLEAITSNRRILGGLGTGMAAKVINNAVAHVVMVLLGEAMGMAKSADVDPNEMVGILSEDNGGLMRPLMHRIAERAFSNDYEGGMPLEAARKDSILAQEMAHHFGVPLFTIPAAHSVYEIAMSNGWARNDYASLVKLWEQWCKISFVQKKSAPIACLGS